MATSVWSAIQAVLGRTAELALRDPALRAALRELGTALTQLAAEPDAEGQGDLPSVPASSPSAEPSAPAAIVSSETVPSEAAVSSVVAPSVNGPTPLPAAVPDRPATPEEIASLFTTPPSPEPVVSYGDFTGSVRSVTDEDLLAIAQRCRIKAEAVRWNSERRQLLAGGAPYETDIAPRDRNLIARAKQVPDCFLWMIHTGARQGTSPASSDQLAFNFETAAAAAELLSRLASVTEVPGELVPPVLEAAAEAQSALRMAVADYDADCIDRDQERLFFYLKDAAFRRRVLIRRFMRRDDPANPFAWQDVQKRIQALDERLREGVERERNRQRLWKKLRSHADQISKGGGSRYHWEHLVEAVANLVADGIPPSSVEIREQVLPLIDELPEDLEPPPSFRLVRREIDRYLATRDDKAESAAAPEVDPQIQEVADLLRGRTLVLIGGERRPYAVQSLTSAFELSELVWINAPEHSSYTAFEPAVARPDTTAVLLAIRWSSHSFGEVKEYCDKYGKPLVRLPGGYNPKAVAHQILQQIGGRLRGEAASVNGDSASAGRWPATDAVSR